MEDIREDSIIVSKEDINSLIYSNSERIKLKNNNSARSLVWNNFNLVYLDEKKTNYSVCKGCKKLFALYINGKPSGTNSMKNHKCIGINSDLPRIDNSFSKVPSIKDIEDFNRALVYGLCRDIRPLKTVDDIGFLTTANKLIEMGSKYGRVNILDIIKDRTTLKRKYMPQVYSDCKEKLIKQLKCAKYFCFSTDLWTDKYNFNSYLTITVQFISETNKLMNYCLSTILCKEKTKYKLRQTIRSSLSEFFDNAEHIINESYFITDNGSNINKTFNLWLPCTCHNLNLSLSHAFDEKFMNSIPLIENTIKLSKEMVRYFKKSGLNKKLTKTLKQSVNTRWNSIFTMLESIYTSWDEIKNILNEQSKSNKYIMPNKDIVFELISILEPFKNASDELSSNSIVTINKVVPWKYKIKLHLELCKEKTSNNEFSLLIDNIFKWFEAKYIIEEIHYIASFLDPRYFIVNF